MDILKTIDELEEIIETAGSIPLTGKIAVDKNDLLELIQNLRLDLPNEMKLKQKLIKKLQKLKKDLKHY